MITQIKKNKLPRLMLLYGLAVFIVASFGYSLAQQPEEFVITNYYPSPAGVYSQLTVTNDANLLVPTGDVVTGNVVIGAPAPVTAPAARLTVMGSISHSLGNRLYGINSNTHINLGSGSSITGISGQNRQYCTILGGQNNTASGDFSTAIGGNVAISGISGNAGDFSVRLGEGVTPTGSHSTALGGQVYTAQGDFSVVSSLWNSSNAAYSTVLGGRGSIAGRLEDGSVTGGKYAVIGCGAYTDNTLQPPTFATGDYVVIFHGYEGSEARGDYSVMLAGLGQETQGMYSTLSATRGSDSCRIIAAAQSSTISGGEACSDDGSGSYSGGIYANALGATILGGQNNGVSSLGSNYGKYATVAGGIGNRALGDYSFVAGTHTESSTATGAYSWAAGQYASAAHDKSFVWSSKSSGCSSPQPGSFNICSDGVYVKGVGPRADLAESMDFSKGEPLEEGQLVALKAKDLLGKSKKAYDDNLIGVISSKRTMTLHLGAVKSTEKNLKKLPIALAGRCFVKVNGENSNIKIGDPITSSSVPGIGMKATESGRIIGYAMEDVEFKGKEVKEVLVFVRSGYYLSKNTLQQIKTAKKN